MKQLKLLVALILFWGCSPDSIELECSNLLGQNKWYFKQSLPFNKLLFSNKTIQHLDLETNFSGGLINGAGYVIFTDQSMQEIWNFETNIGTNSLDTKYIYFESSGSQTKTIFFSPNIVYTHECRAWSDVQDVTLQWYLLLRVIE